MSTASVSPVEELPLTTRGTLIRLHPDLGPIVVRNLMFANARLVANSFASDLKTAIFTATKVIGHNWWLVDYEQEKPLDLLQPWPIAGFISPSGLVNSETNPEWVILSLENGFLKQPIGYESLKSTRAALNAFQSTIKGNTYLEVTVCGGLRLVKKENNQLITIAIACRI